MPPPVESELLETTLPGEQEFWRPPARFGSIPIEAEPLGWDRQRGFKKIYPQILLPTQVVERISFGSPGNEPNRLFWGDNLHVMRQLPSGSINLIYIDPPFFSGRHYNVIFGDQNELRSFGDIWEGGLPGYLIWLNARLYEMKRLLKPTGNIFVHLDWHAVHYVKQEMDKLFGSANFRNEIIWAYDSGGRAKSAFSRKHDSLLQYGRGKLAVLHPESVAIPRNKCAKCGRELDQWNHMKRHTDQDGRVFRTIKSAGKIYKYYDDDLVAPSDVWMDINHIQQKDPERIGYPTQKPEKLLERVILASSSVGDVVADFFAGGGTTPVVAQRLGRRWIACDQSRVAVAITADRLMGATEQITISSDSSSASAPDFTVEHWGIYEADRLAHSPRSQFVKFVLSAFGAVEGDSVGEIHGRKGAVPVWVGDATLKSQVTAGNVQDFANAIRKTPRYQQDNLRDGIMLAWAFRPDAAEAAQRLRDLEATELNFVRMELIGIGSSRFREHVQMLSTGRADYGSFLTFVQPPVVRVGWKWIRPQTYRFDVSETAVMNPGAKIINVQWDLHYRGPFRSSQGYSFVRTSEKDPALQIEYTFTSPGKHSVACKVQDDAGGEGIWAGELAIK